MVARDLAQRAVKGNWSAEDARQIVEAEVAASPNLRKGAATAISEGRLASDPAVRSGFDRLHHLRDEAWARDRDFLRRIKHGPSQLLIDILRRQQSPSQCCHVATVDSYLSFMREEYKYKL
jgi:hypothetical protein